jgi:hypothetical protein
MSVFETLNSINVNDKTEKKNGLTYLSWAWAWGEAKKVYPNAIYTIYENKDGWNYFTDGKTCWVKTGVTIEGLEHIEYLPVMDYRNKSITADNVTSFDVNKAIQRSLTKALARHGLGLYIYAGEDLPDVEVEPKVTEVVKLSKVTEQNIIKLIEQYSEKRNGNVDQLTKYYLKKCNVNSLTELTEECGKKIVAELLKMIDRRVA